ncbi:small-conductance mechanosensitive channel [Rhizobium binae]|uniref:Small-conductance mechanosensitive channel n=1 Tax=Rhizobium binae TaxID=1138190 RepID=A0ABV2MFY5_9HYPH|nr:mechanosensitive ion channel family protein [Rhizobium binae]MBX4994669.1 mechanosensitive ion channel family protein [Rhizobium binae]NKL49929.1 mechanosensitive ion channel [Rhizobium leguminosarum bv. viciae]QSY85208.1 mechanosensitive ion channel family protein [Rhizobium binae]
MRTSLLQRTMLCLCLLLFTAQVSSYAQNAQTSSPSSTVALSKEQLDQLVTDVSDAVIRKLADKPVASSTQSHPVSVLPEKSASILEQDLDTGTSRFFHRLIAVITALPQLPQVFSSTFDQLDDTNSDGRDAGSFLSLVLVAIGTAIFLQFVVISFGSQILNHRLSADEPPTLMTFGLIALVNVLAFSTAWIVCDLAKGTWFAGMGIEARVGKLLLNVVLQLSFYGHVILVWFRPRRPSLRIVALDDDTNRVTSVFLAITIAANALRSWILVPMAAGVSSDAIAAGLLINALSFAAVLTWCVIHWRRAIGKLVATSLGWWKSGQEQERIVEGWLFVALPLIALRSLVDVYGAVEGHHVEMTAINVVIGVILAESLFKFFQRRLAAAAAKDSTVAPSRHFYSVLIRAARLVIIISAVIYVLHIWLGEALGIFTPAQWNSWKKALVRAGVVALVAYIAWEAMRYIVGKYMDTATLPPQTADASLSSSVRMRSSRILTLMPVVRVTLSVLIVIVTTLMVLSELGVNTAPLIASASIFGLAVSFGSQSLVRDIVSGIFYLADDAFRVGEYIDCNKVKGTVEGFTLRSVRLRHQSGQLHTVPFGQLGQITNFSRDWSTVKFQINFARHTDLERLRMITKSVGIELMDNPDYKDAILEPLKLKGISDITENALVVNFKLVIRADSASGIEADAKWQILEACRREGIELSSSLPSSAQLKRDSADDRSMAVATQQSGETDVNTAPDRQRAAS